MCPKANYFEEEPPRRYQATEMDLTECPRTSRFGQDGRVTARR